MKRNLIANFFGSAFTSIISIIVIPLYIKYLGPQSYGFIGIYTVLQSIFTFLDLGFGAGINREMAHLSAEGRIDEARSIFRTVEILYWLLGGLICLIIYASSHLIASRWLNNSSIDTERVSSIVRLIGYMIFFKWPYAIYASGFLGIQKHELYNKINSLCELSKAVLTIIVLIFIDNKIEAFFYAQMIITGLYTIVLAIKFWSIIQKQKAQFKIRELKRIWKFSLGMSGIQIIASLLTQTDKIVLSKVLSMEYFGYYTAAFTLTSIIPKISAPIYQTVYPKLTEFFAKRDFKNLIQIYHNYSQLNAVMLIPIGIMCSFFSKEILFLWSNNIKLTNSVKDTFSILIIGSMLNGIMVLPYALQLAYKYTRLYFFSNLISVIIVIPMTILFANKFGMNGAAMSWTLLNLGYILIVVPLMHKKILPDEMIKWYISDLFLPLFRVLIISIIATLLFKNLISYYLNTDRILDIFFVGCCMFLVFAISTFATRFTKNFSKLFFYNLRSFKKKII